MQAQKRLDSDEIAQLVDAYQAGEGVKKLAARFGIHRDTVHNILKREGVLRCAALQTENLPLMIRLYEAGWSLAQLGDEFDVSANTVGRALRKAGVSIRPPGRRVVST